MKYLLILLLNTVCLSGILKAQDYNILDYGAVKNDTSKLSTGAINKAVDACYQAGGGRVFIPSGIYKSGTITLKDNVELYLDRGAVLYASTSRSDFRQSALIYARDAVNIGVAGKGTINGLGATQKSGGPGRRSNILFISCRKISVEGISMMNSGNWNQHYSNCEDVMVNNIHVDNHSNKNNDGIDINGCRRFVLSNSIIDSDDDAIVLKSTGFAGCEDIVITNCVISSYTNAIKCGTESVGGFKNIAISNCVIKPTRSTVESKFGLPRPGITGISLEIVDGGVMEGVNINNTVIEGTECPIYVRLGNRGRKRPADASAGQIRNIQINGVTAYNTGNYSSSITGVPGAKIENISLDNIRIINKGGVKAGDYLADYGKVKEDEKGYPQPDNWKNLPSYGFFIRHVKNISLSNIRLGSLQPDPRVPVLAVDVDWLSVKNFHAESSGADTEFLLKDVKDYSIDSKAVRHIK